MSFYTFKENKFMREEIDDVHYTGTRATELPPFFSFLLTHLFSIKFLYLYLYISFFFIYRVRVHISIKSYGSNSLHMPVL